MSQRHLKDGKKFFSNASRFQFPRCVECVVLEYKILMKTHVAEEKVEWEPGSFGRSTSGFEEEEFISVWNENQFSGSIGDVDGAVCEVLSIGESFLVLLLCQGQCCKQATQDMSALHSSSLSSAAKNEGGGALEGSINRAEEAAGQWRIYYNDESKKLLSCFQFSNSSR